jgi:hypothetical protein
MQFSLFTSEEITKKMKNDLAINQSVTFPSEHEQWIKVMLGQGHMAAGFRIRAIRPLHSLNDHETFPLQTQVTAISLPNATPNQF